MGRCDVADACRAIPGGGLDRPHLVRADALAWRYQRRHRVLGALLFVFAALAVTSAAAADLLGSEGPLSPIEVTLMLLLLTGLIVGRADWHDRWIGYRSLAEAFRSSPFIILAGLRDEGDHPIERRHEHWFQRAFSEDAWGERPRVTIEKSGAPAVEQFLIKAWIEEQRQYHDRTAVRPGRQRRALTGLVGMSFAATRLAALIELLNGKSKPLTILTITLPASALR